MPIDGVGTVIAICFPSGNFGYKFFDFGDTTVETLCFEGTEFDFCDVKPASVFGSIMNFEPAGQTQSEFGVEGFIWLAQGQVERVYTTGTFSFRLLGFETAYPIAVMWLLKRLNPFNKSKKYALAARSEALAL